MREGTSVEDQKRSASQRNARWLALLLAVAGLAACAEGNDAIPDSAENGAESPTSVTDPGSASSTVAVPGSDSASSTTSPAPAASVTDESNEQLIGFVTALLGVADPSDTAKAFEPTPDQQAVKQCVEAAGFEYHIYVPLANDPSTTMTAEDYAATWGLGITAQILGTYPQPSTDDIDYLEGLSEGERSAYDAVVADCVDTAGFDPTRTPAIQSAAERFRAELLVDPLLQDATETWSACMADVGYDYASPDAMRQYFYSAVIAPDADLQSIQHLEIQTSIANLSCEPAYRSVYTDLVVNRFDEFLTLLDDPTPPEQEGNG